MDIETKLEVTGQKKYKDPNFKDSEKEEVKQEPKLEVKEVVDREPVVKVGDTIVKPIRFEYLSEANQKLIAEKGKGWITRNSVCPCGSGKRFKKCCMDPLREEPKK